MGKRIRRLKAWLIDYAYLVTIGAVVAVVAASAMYTRHFKAQQQADIAAAAQAPEVERMTLRPAETIQKPASTPLPTIAPLQVRYMALNPNAGTVWPTEGAVLRAYDAQSLVFWEALGSYGVHTGLDIAGEAGGPVRCAADGVVSSSVRDELWGWRVIVDQTDGRQAVYAGLQEAEVMPQQAVTRGQRIGMLMERIPCEAEMGPHLHMELYRDGKPQDPEGMMPER